MENFQGIQCADPLNHFCVLGTRNFIVGQWSGYKSCNSKEFIFISELLHILHPLEGILRMPVWRTE
jgi:hypothetical protein